MVVLESNPINIDQKEREWIKKLKPQLFNMVNGGSQTWRHHNREPWMAGQGVKCPSDLLMFYLKNRGYSNCQRVFEKIKGIKKNMSVYDRCVFELQLCIDWYSKIMTEKFEKWLLHTEDRLIKVLLTHAC